VTTYGAANGIGEGVTHRFSSSPANHHSTSASSSSVIAPEVCGYRYTQHIGISPTLGGGGHISDLALHPLGKKAVKVSY